MHTSQLSNSIARLAMGRAPMEIYCPRVRPASQQHATPAAGRLNKDKGRLSVYLQLYCTCVLGCIIITLRSRRWTPSWIMMTLIFRSHFSCIFYGDHDSQHELAMFVFKIRNVIRHIAQLLHHGQNHHPIANTERSIVHFLVLPLNVAFCCNCHVFDGCSSI